MIPERYKNVEFSKVPDEIKKLFLNILVSKRGIYIHGSVGTGKTWIAYALMSEYQKYIGGVIFKRTVDLLASIREDMSKPFSEKENLVDRILNTKQLLILDDIGAEKITDFSAEQFYRIINNRYESSLPIIFTSNLSVSQLSEKVGDRIVSRIIEMCDIVEIKGEDRRMESVNKITI